MNEIENRLAINGTEKRIRYSLESFSRALDHVGNPEQSVYTIVIAGTNGKGSTSLFVSSALAEAGLKVATYLSPHLQSVQERFLWNLRQIPENEMLGVIDELTPVAKKFELTYFEFLTLVFFTWAKSKSVDFSVLEVGLGGRLDATNVTDPVACAITSIDWDHQAFLGDTLEKILFEKMGILRKESLVFTGITQPELRKSLETYCHTLDAIYYHSTELKREVIERDWNGQSVTLNGYPFKLTNPSTGTLSNAATAFLLLRIAFPRISIETMQAAFARVETPGRMEVVAHKPRVVLSGDHNPAGVDCLLETLERLPKEGKLHVVCGFSADKPFKQMFEKLSTAADSIRLTRIPNVEPLREYFEMGKVVEDPHAAIDEALSAAKPEDTVLITGSLYLIGAIRERWKNTLSK